MDNAYPVEGMNADLHFPDTVNPQNWRNMPDPENDLENDEDVPAAAFVISALGFDPDELDWEEDDGESPEDGSE